MTHYWPSLLAMLFCIVMSAFFSASETAFSSLSRTRLQVLAEAGNRKALLTLKLSENYDKLLSTILIGNNIDNIAVASIGTLVFVQLYGDIGATLSTVVVTIVVLIFGEVTPKSIAKDFPEKFAMFSAPLLNLLVLLLTPVNFLFAQWKRLVSRLFKGREEAKMSQEELLLLLREAEQEGGIDRDEGELLKNAVEFGDLRAQDILTHRTEVEAVSVDATREEIARTFAASHLSRLPVFDGNLDHIIGILHQKDFYAAGGITNRPVREVMTAPLFIRPTEKIDDLLRRLQAHKSHMAVVLDEYGGTLGIVTMEDILEELVGEIWDEHDEIAEPFRQLEPDVYLVDGAVSFADFCEYFRLKAESESLSLGGWVTERLEKIPEPGESFEYGNVRVIVEKADGQHVESLRVLRLGTSRGQALQA